MIDYDTKKKKKELSHLQYWDENNFCGWAMSQKLPVYNFKWIQDLLNSMKISLKLMFNILKSYMTFTMIYHFCLK